MAPAPSGPRTRGDHWPNRFARPVNVTCRRRHSGRREKDVALRNRLHHVAVRLLLERSRSHRAAGHPHLFLPDDEADQRSALFRIGPQHVRGLLGAAAKPDAAGAGELVGRFRNHLRAGRARQGRHQFRWLRSDLGGGQYRRRGLFPLGQLELFHRHRVDDPFRRRHPGQRLRRRADEHGRRRRQRAVRLSDAATRDRPRAGPQASDGAVDILCRRAQPMGPRRRL